MIARSTEASQNIFLLRTIQDVFRLGPLNRRDMTASRIPSLQLNGALALFTALGVSGVLAEENVVATHCFTTAETRDKIIGQKLGDPFVSMRAAETRVKGEALNARLCRKGDTFIYEICLVRQDGRVVKLLYDAATGQALSLRKND
jgi:hypothetical protein